ncbi:MAG: hypothetical protein K8F91_15925 [Candidatus Obscuribacterales bacterium]|nr:hypothetical protein [Candidatus Obscuribacterales bacterium]
MEFNGSFSIVRPFNGHTEKETMEAGFAGFSAERSSSNLWVALLDDCRACLEQNNSSWVEENLSDALDCGV